jgi:rubredoxin
MQSWHIVWTNPHASGISAEESSMKQWQCIVCGFIYDEESGLPEDGIAPGTPWEDIPDDWMCPDCGVGKDDFEMVEL